MHASIENPRGNIDSNNFSRQLHILNRISKYINSLSGLEDGFWKLYELIGELMPADALNIGLCDENRDLLDWLFVVEQGKRLLTDHYLLASEIIHQAISKREPVYRNAERNLSDSNNHSKEACSNSSISTIVAPLMIRGHVVGVIAVKSHHHGLYTAIDAEILSIISCQLSLALHNCGVFQRLQKESNHKDQLVETAKENEKLLSIVELARSVAHELNQPLTGIAGYCALAKEELDREHPTYNDITEIQNQAARLENLIYKFQKIAHLEYSDGIERGK